MVVCNFQACKTQVVMIVTDPVIEAMAKHTHTETLNTASDPSLTTPMSTNAAAPSAYDRQTAGQAYTERSQKERRNRRIRRILIPVLSVLLVLVFAGAGFGLWYTSQLDRALGYDDAEEAAALKEILVSREIDQPFYVLLLGSDSREGTGTSGNVAEQGDNERSDVMILVRVDPIEKQLTMVSIPRDTPYHVDGTTMKINEAYNYGGARASVEAVTALTGVNIAHVVEVRFSDLEKIVDDLGGVTVYVDTELSCKDALTGEWVTLEPGEQLLNGQQAQIFARVRKAYDTDQDAHRQDHVRELCMAILKKALDRPLTDLPATVMTLAGCVDTDMNTSDALSLAMDFAGDISSMTVYSTTGPSDGDFMEEYDGLWYCYDNPEAWKRLMAVVDAGEDPNAVDWLSDPAEVDEGAVDEEVGVSQYSDEIVFEENWVAPPQGDQNWDDSYYYEENPGDTNGSWSDVPVEPAEPEPPVDPNQEPTDVPGSDMPSIDTPPDVEGGNGDDNTGSVEPTPTPEPTPDPDPVIPEAPVEPSTPAPPDVPADGGDVEA